MLSGFEMNLIEQCRNVNIPISLPPADSGNWVLDKERLESTVVKCFDNTQRLIAQFKYEPVRLFSSNEKELTSYTLFKTVKDELTGHEKVYRKTYSVARGQESLLLHSYYEYDKNGRYVALGIVSDDGTESRIPAR